MLEYLYEKLDIQWDPAPDGGGFYERLVVEFGLHPMSSRRMFDALPWMFEFREMYNKGFGEPDRQPYESEFRQLIQHPLAAEKIVHEFLNQVHNASQGFGCSGSVDACEACQSLRDSYWNE